MTKNFLPTETWQTVLRYAISVPVFFEINPVEMTSIEAMIIDYYDPSPYYDAERTRNILRRVCSSWNHYLIKFSHRFIEFTDVIHGRIRPKSLSKAVRISMRICRCLSCASIRLFDSNKAPIILEKALRDSKELWSLEILDGEWWKEQWKWLSKLHNRAPRLKSVPRQTSSDWDTIISLFPDVTFLNTATHDHEILPTPSSINSEHLTTISIDLTNLQDCRNWTLPSLKYFSFFAVEVTVEDYLTMADSIGRNLIVLYDCSWRSSETLPDKIWQLCPRIERFQTSFTWSSEPTFGTSLKSIRIRPDLIDEGTNLEDRVPVTALKKAGITSIGIDVTWWEIAMNQELKPCLEIQLEGGYFVRDAAGVSFPDFVIMLIRTYWKRECQLNAYTKGISTKFFWF